MGLFRPIRLNADDVHEIIDAKVAWIREAADPLQIWVFGSAARDEMTEASDVDIALVFGDEEEIKQARRAIHPRPRPDLWPQDLAFFTQADFENRSSLGGLPLIIANEGRLVYERGESQ